MTKHSSPSFQDRLRDLREALKPAGDAECKNLIQRICIMPRGEITRVFNSLYRGFVMMLQRTASIWLTQLPKLQSDLTVLCEFTPICDAIVVADNCPLSKIEDWANLSNEEIRKYRIIKASWVLDSLKARKILPAAPYSFEVDAAVPAPVSQFSTKDDEDRPPLHRDTTVEASASPMPKKAKVDSSKFACVQSGTISNNNNHITDVLDQLMEGDEWRKLSYKKASNALKKMDAIHDISQLDGVKGFGSSIRDKIHEVITTGTLKKLENFKSDPTVGVRMEFCKIWGVGPKKAHDLAMAGYKSIPDLRARGCHLLTKQQRVGLMRFEDLQERIPRQEMDEIKTFVIDAAESILPGIVEYVHFLNLILSYLSTSHRRGKSTSGDIDILFGPPPNEEELIFHLSEIGFLTDHLTLPDEHRSPDTSLSYMGVCKLPGENRKYRRIDLKSYPRSQFAFALLYFTGSDHFNRSLRLYCNKIGYTLNDKGLSKCSRDNSRKKIWSGNSIVCNTEKEIFDFLEMDYKEPCERNIYEEQGSPTLKQEET